MEIAYFDTIAGISGDMTLGAFISAGVLLDDLIDGIRKLDLDGIELTASHIQRSGITAVKLDEINAGQQEHHWGLHDIYQVIDESALSIRVKDDAKKIFMEVAKAKAKIHNSLVEKILNN
jgi:pyridinium-3,5-bisthiocarboxylic acid mononucleotide nickel chelatase